MSDTQTTTDDGQIQMPSGTEVYDGLMSAIEPELVSSNLAHLDEPYVNETPEEHDARYERYNNAFAQYEIAFAKWMSDLQQAVRSFRRTAIATAEAENKLEEQEGAMSAIEMELETEPTTQATSPQAV